MSSVAQKILQTPIEIQNLVESDALLTIIDNICKEHNIPLSWQGELIRGTVRILCGEMNPKDFVDFIIDEYWTEEEEAIAIAQKINQRIFSLVKPQLALVHHIADDTLAHQIRVPKKPKREEETPEDTQPEKIIQNVPSPYVSHTQNTPEHSNASPVQQTTTITEERKHEEMTPSKQSIQTALTSKLGGLGKNDPYREL